MALILAKFNSGLTRSKLSAVLGTTRKQFRQFVLYTDPDNTGSVYLGPSTVTGVPANETFRLIKDKSLNLGPQDAGYPFVVDTEALYCVGSAADQILYVIANTDDARI